MRPNGSLAHRCPLHGSGLIACMDCRHNSHHQLLAGARVNCETYTAELQRRRRVLDRCPLARHRQWDHLLYCGETMNPCLHDFGDPGTPDADTLECWRHWRHLAHQKKSPPPVDTSRATWYKSPTQR